MQENTDQNNSEYAHFLRNGKEEGYEQNDYSRIHANVDAGF